ncbi:protein unc-93 homolog A-like [Physella acuta]|uniref:protein unc-93 homolog A-like n=1 Tax=Physella acuta TaxID=109671 RepID=UPI0027DDDDB7|nr:protein unc-93 homolog A-like [Physella acuta]
MDETENGDEARTATLKKDIGPAQQGVTTLNIMANGFQRARGGKYYGGLNNRNLQASTSFQGSQVTVVTESPKPTPRAADDHLPPIKTHLALSISNLLVYTSYNGIQNIQSSINDKDDLGIFTLATVYTTVFLLAPFATIVIRKFGCKNLLLLSWASMGLFAGANFYPRFSTLIPASFLIGACGTCIGVINNIYLAAASDRYIKNKKLGSEKRHQILSIFFGAFFTFFEASQISGNLTSSLVLFTNSPGSADNATFDHTTPCGADMCYLNSTASSHIKRPSQDTLYMLFGIFLGCVALGFLVSLFLLPRLRLPEPAVPRSVCQEMMSCFKVLVSLEFALLLPAVMGQAMMVMVIFTGYTSVFITCSLGVEWVGFVMMAYGTSTAIFATLANYLARYLGRIFLFLTFILLDTGLLFTMLFWNPGHDGSKLILFSIAGAAGISEGISQAQFSSIISIVFQKDLPPALVTYNMTKCIAFSASLAISTFACFYYRLYIAIALYIVGLFGYIGLEILVNKRGTKRNKADQKPLLRDVRS